MTDEELEEQMLKAKPPAYDWRLALPDPLKWYAQTPNHLTEEGPFATEAEAWDACRYADTNRVVPGSCVWQGSYSNSRAIWCWRNPGDPVCRTRKSVQGFAMLYVVVYPDGERESVPMPWRRAEILMRQLNKIPAGVLGSNLPDFQARYGYINPPHPLRARMLPMSLDIEQIKKDFKTVTDGKLDKDDPPAVRRLAGTVPLAVGLALTFLLSVANALGFTLPAGEESADTSTETKAEDEDGKSGDEKEAGGGSDRPRANVG